MNGCCWVMMVGWPGMMVRRVTTRRTRCTVRARVTRWARARWTTRLRILGTLRTCCTSCDREGACDTCTAPPPISAPPQVQAQSFAKAIRTDIHSSCLHADPPDPPGVSARRCGDSRPTNKACRMQTAPASVTCRQSRHGCNGFNHALPYQMAFAAAICRICGFLSRFRTQFAACRFFESLLSIACGPVALCYRRASTDRPSD
jgi:hypothetical protein